MTVTSPPVVLAKKPRERTSPRPEETLVGHTASALACFTKMFGRAHAPTRLAQLWLAFFRVPKVLWPAFWRNGPLAVALHDVGKANSGFQGMLLRGKPQVLWHDHLGAMLLGWDEIGRWFGSLPEIDGDLVRSVVAAHHLRSAFETFGERLDADRDAFEPIWPGILDVLEVAARTVDAAPPTFDLRDGFWSLGGPRGFDCTPLRKATKDMLRKLRRALGRDENRARLLWAVRSAVILADSAGSGLVREGHDIAEWLDEAFSPRLVLDGAYIEREVIEPRVREIKEKKGSFQWSGFQVAADDLPARALLLAPCGSGKTLAAWRWIRAQLDRRPASRVLFLYPTRATATEGFRDYVSWAPEADARLLTGTAAYELEGMFENPADPRSGKNFTDEDRLFALAFWHRRIFSATVDQFFGFLQHVYKSTCLLPLLADSVVVIDEVHSFDRSLFSALKGFLQTFDVPVLCMTATLPANRRAELVGACGLTPFPAEAQDFPDLAAKAKMPRYRTKRIDRDDAPMIVQEALDQGKRVLWVVNTVSRCQQLALTHRALCYHSRYRLRDRKKRHREVVDAFQAGSGPVLAVTTQVCEMSLDLDAHVLVSEDAPVTSLIQRMGRCNRHAEPGAGSLGEVFLYEPEDWNPYSPEDLAGTAEFVAAVDGRCVSQEELEELLERHGPKGVQPDTYTAFLLSGPWAVSGEERLRDARDHSVPSILRGDLPEYFDLKRSGEPVDGLVVPAPRRLVRPDTRLGRLYQVAPSENYDPQYGLLDSPQVVIE
ncbi:CRISPR-associated helicase/endonuclease Cas3 [Deferrisoma camini]|uniref:CRISPR-associated helicase/endonuclease Cas3 n=1 Tax=Deferrisoma camini TaxID=1035120 RepID=UPI000A024A9C|nr:CRISPR-associated helicase/endonuclease Cas3 [Deferrisoma camini]